MQWETRRIIKGAKGAPKDEHVSDPPYFSEMNTIDSQQIVLQIAQVGFSKINFAGVSKISLSIAM